MYLMLLSAVVRKAALKLFSPHRWLKIVREERGIELCFAGH